MSQLEKHTFSVNNGRWARKNGIKFEQKSEREKFRYYSSYYDLKLSVDIELRRKISDCRNNKGTFFFSGDFLVTLKVLSSQKFWKSLKISYICTKQTVLGNNPTPYHTYCSWQSGLQMWTIYFWQILEKNCVKFLIF